MLEYFLRTDIVKHSNGRGVKWNVRIRGNVSLFILSGSFKRRV